MTSSGEQMNFLYLLKFIIIGDSAVGKSNMLLRYIHDRFNEDFHSTIGVEFGAKNIQIDGKVFRIQIWDTAGQETFRSITRAYYKNSVCAFVVYDISNRATFDNIKSWVEDCKRLSPKTVLMVLVGNKIDLEERREVSYNEGSIFAQKNGMLFFECSAKTGNNVEQIFMESTREIYKRIKEGFYDLENENCIIKRGTDSDNITLSKENQNSNGGFCCM
jgi:small GTP-binding protein